MGSKPTHAFVPCNCGAPAPAHCAAVQDHGMRLCCLPRSAHPASPPEPAPESEEHAFDASGRYPFRCAVCGNLAEDHVPPPARPSPPEPAPPDMQAALLRFLRNRETHTPLTAEAVEHWLGLWNAESRPPSPPEPKPESEELGPDDCGACYARFDGIGVLHKENCPMLFGDEEAPSLLPARPDPAPEPEKLRRLAEEWIAENLDSKWIEDRDSLIRLLERVIRECADIAWQSDAMSIREDGSNVLRAFGLSPSPESKKENR